MAATTSPLLSTAAVSHKCCAHASAYFSSSLLTKIETKIGSLTPLTKWSNHTMRAHLLGFLMVLQPSWWHAAHVSARHGYQMRNLHSSLKCLSARNVSGAAREWCSTKIIRFVTCPVTSSFFRWCEISSFFRVLSPGPFRWGWHGSSTVCIVHRFA